MGKRGAVPCSSVRALVAGAGSWCTLTSLRAYRPAWTNGVTNMRHYIREFLLVSRGYFVGTFGGYFPYSWGYPTWVKSRGFMEISSVGGGYLSDPHASPAPLDVAASLALSF